MSSAVRITSGRSHASNATALSRVARSAATETTVRVVGPALGTGCRQSVFATADGRTRWYVEPSTEEMTTIVTALEGETTPPEPVTTVSHEPEPQQLPAGSTGPFGAGRRWVSTTAGWLEPADFDAYRSTRGVVADDIEPAVAREQIDGSGLRGRGRGDIARDSPIFEHWERARSSPGTPVVVVNANETTPYGHADRSLLEGTPISVLDGALTTAIAIGATDILIYCPARQTLAIGRTEQAIEALAPRFDRYSIRVTAGPATYLAGEVTMALEAIEGADRLEARLRPPHPSEWGLNGSPTVVHTPRTLVQIVELLRSTEDPPGTTADPGTRLLSIAGAVETAVTVEVPTGTTLSNTLAAVETTGQLKGACVGDVFGGVVRSLDVPVSADGLRAAGCGTNGVVELFTQDQCPLAIVGERAKFAAENNCGRCVTCREGSKQLQKLLREFYTGSPDTQLLQQLARVLAETSLCSFGRDAARPVATGLEAFEPEFQRHTEGTCPAGQCDL